MPDFAASLPAQRLTMYDYAHRLKAFLDDLWLNKHPAPAGFQRPVFVVSGFDPGSTTPMIMSFNLGLRSSAPVAQEITGNWGLAAGEAALIVARLIVGIDAAFRADVVRQFAGLVPEDQEKIVRLTQAKTRALGDVHIRPKSDSECNDLIRFLFATAQEIQAALSTPNVFHLGSPIDVAVVTPGRGFTRR
jgi:hypothetical protein